MAVNANKIEDVCRGRLAFEQLVQMVSVCVSILDRIVLAALFYRFWGEYYFEVWSVALAIAGLIGFSQLGFVSYYQNTITKALQRGEVDKAKQRFRESFSILSITSLIGVFALALYTVFHINTDLADGIIRKHELVLATILLFVCAAAKIPVSNIEALYRANREYSKYAMILLSGALLRVALISAVVMSFTSNLILAAAAAFTAITSMQVGFVLYDKSKRFPEFKVEFALPCVNDFKKAITRSCGFFVNTLTTVLLASLPILILNNNAEAAGVISTFVITRILFGLPRILSQATSVVIGHEASRFIVAGDYKRVWGPLIESSRTVALLSGIIAGSLFCFGDTLTYLWTRSSTIFKWDLALAAALPALIMPAATIANNVLMTANKAHEVAIARITQLLLFICIYAVLPVMKPALSVMLALSLSEIFGFALLAKYFCCKVLRVYDAKFIAEDTVIALITASGIISTHWWLV